MDLNLVVLSGRLAAPIEVRVFESGSRLIRLLMTVRTDRPRSRVAVVPVTVWNPEDSFLESEPQPGERLWVAGSLQRRFWDSAHGRRSRIELVAEQVTRRSSQLDLAVPCDQ